MTYLLDTHLLLWLAAQPGRLPDPARDIIEDRSVDSWYSVASLWEVAIKSGLERGDFDVDARILRRGLLAGGFLELPIDAAHVVAVTDLPKVHHDPFDRLLVAQARSEGMTLLTVDERLSAYGGCVRLLYR